MKTMSEIRNERMQAELNSLLSLLDDAGFTSEKRYGYGSDSGARPDSWNDDIRVRDPDGRVIATVRMYTGTTWNSAFNGWTLKSPMYKPRGDYDRNCNAENPADPQHWGKATIQKTSTVVQKIMQGMASLPTKNDIEIGKLTRDNRELRRKEERIRQDRLSLFRSPILQMEIYQALCNDKSLSDPLQKMLRKYAKKTEALRQVKTERQVIINRIDKLEAEDAS